MALSIYIKTIAHEKQRYPTVGDWFFEREGPDNIKLVILISDMGNPWFEYLVAQHEQMEAMLCLRRGILEKSVSDFDIAFEEKRFEDNVDEPGDDPAAPYYKEHQYATIAERSMALELEIDWRTYDQTVSAL